MHKSFFSLWVAIKTPIFVNHINVKEVCNEENNKTNRTMYGAHDSSVMFA